MDFISHRGFASKLLTVGLIAALPFVLQPVTAAELSSVKGTVFVSEQGSPMTGARVHLVQTGTSKVFTSSVTSTEGAFEVSGLPAGTYEAAIEIDGGVYIVETPVVVAHGAKADLNLLVPGTGSSGKQQQAVAGSAGFLSSPLAATLLVLGSALSVGALIDAQSDDDDASPF